MRKVCFGGPFALYRRPGHQASGHFRHNNDYVTPALPVFGFVGNAATTLTTAPAAALRYKAKGVRPASIDSMMALEPRREVGLIREGDRIERSDSFTKAVADAHIAALMRHPDVLHLKQVFETDDPVLNGALLAEMDTLFLKARKSRFLANGIRIPYIDSVARAAGMRHVLLMHNAGFTRTNANFRTEDRKTIAPYVLSLGMYMPVTIMSVSYLRLMILDVGNHKTLYFSDDYTDMAGHRQSPASEPAIYGQIRALFYFFFPLPRD